MVFRISKGEEVGQRLSVYAWLTNGIDGRLEMEIQSEQCVSVSANPYLWKCSFEAIYKLQGFWTCHGDMLWTDSDDWSVFLMQSETSSRCFFFPYRENLPSGGDACPKGSGNSGETMLKICPCYGNNDNQEHQIKSMRTPIWPKGLDSRECSHL